MSWSLNIGSIAGTQVRVHITFLLFLGWLFAAAWVTEGSHAAWSGLILRHLAWRGKRYDVVVRRGQPVRLIAR